MKTLRLKIDPAHLDEDEARQALRQAAEILQAGGLVAFPTETVYGLGANALDAQAVARIFAAKERPNWDPLIVHVSGVEKVEKAAASTPETALKLMQAYWPGPLTLLLPRAAAIPEIVTAGRALVGVRAPSHPVARALIRAAGLPVAAPSANRFGHTSPTTAEHVLEDLDGRIDAVLDAGPAEHGVESTVLDPCQNPMVIYRPGAVTAEQIRAVAGPVEFFQPAAELAAEPREALPSPGVGIRHYAPRARVVLVEGSRAGLPALLAAAALASSGERIGLLLPEEFSTAAVLQPIEATRFPWGRWEAPDELAQNLYAGLRALDAAGCSVIVCPMPPEAGVGAAIRDRLRKAAK